ncbi:MAG: hypothetical protein K2W95_20195 [Candidatus Obscuribacterales bacterium]|nr:hypothetical protein [Candidatus Obscuribacterales bacterium]
MNNVGPHLPGTQQLECVPDDDSGHRLTEQEKASPTPVHVITEVGWNDEKPLTASGALRVSQLRKITPAKQRSWSLRINGPALVEQYAFEVRHWLGLEREGFEGERNRRREITALALGLVAILIVLASTDFNKSSTTELSAASSSSNLE